MTEELIGPQKSGEAEAIIIVKAAPQVGQRHGETVCCAGIDLYGRWLRMYPITFRNLEESQRFSRWDRVRFRWRRPSDDRREESRRVDQGSLSIVGQLKKSERSAFLAPMIVSNLREEREKGHSLALLRAKIHEFHIERKTPSDIEEEKRKFIETRAQLDFFNGGSVVPYSPCPYTFQYRYESDDGMHNGTCQDWELEATFFHWSNRYGEDRALSDMEQVFGRAYPHNGMLLAMGTHSRFPDTWLINGVIRLDEVSQLPLF